jgi:hypothetical protein
VGGQAPVSAEGIAAVMHAPRSAKPGRPGEKHERVHGHSVLADEELDVGRYGLAQVRQVGQELNCGPVDRGNFSKVGVERISGPNLFLTFSSLSGWACGAAGWLTLRIVVRSLRAVARSPVCVAFVLLTDMRGVEMKRSRLNS